MEVDPKRVDELTWKLTNKCEKAGMRPEEMAGLSPIRIRFLLYNYSGDDVGNEIIKKEEFDPDFWEVKAVSQKVRANSEAIYLTELFDVRLVKNEYMTKYGIKTTADIRSMSDLERKMVINTLGAGLKIRFRALLRLLDKEV